MSKTTSSSAAAIRKEVARQVAAIAPRRVALNTSASYTPRGLHTIDIGVPFADLILIPCVGGAIANLDTSRGAEGILRCSFHVFTRLSAAYIFPVAADPDVDDQ